MKQAKVFLNNTLAGILTEDDMGYDFRYDSDYLKSDDAVAVSLTLPLTDMPYATAAWMKKPLQTFSPDSPKPSQNGMT